jgi:hypothetical protein
VLALLAIWCVLVLVWVGFLFLGSDDVEPPSSQFSRLHKRSAEEPGLAYDELVFLVAIPAESDPNSAVNLVRTLVGGFHQLKAEPGRVPFVYIHDNGALPDEFSAETQAWSKVEVVRGKIEDTMHTLLAGFGHVLEIPVGYILEPVGLEIRRADLITDPELFREAYKLGRERIEQLGVALREHGRIEVAAKDGSGAAIKGELSGATKKSVVSLKLSVGLIAEEESSTDLPCHVDLKPEAVTDGAVPVDSIDRSELASLRDSRLPVVGLGVPTTSKGLNWSEKHVLMRALLPSLAATLTRTELKRFKIAVLIGFDEGDLLFEDAGRRSQMRRQMAKLLPKQASIVFLRLRPLKRVALAWSMIFALAHRYNVTWLYQVNDDLTMETAGWLTAFTEQLGALDNLGVAGPSDSFNDFRCSLLTQSFVHRRHLDVFGFFYPLEIRDWKSDRWMSFVYPSDRTFCWLDIKARNGAAGTRYAACPFWSWRVYLEREQAKLKSLE